MKKMMALLLILSCLLAKAQTFHYGIKADMNFSNISGKGMGTSLISGAEIGGMGQLEINKEWSIQPELLFTQSNTKKADDFLVYYNLNGNNFAGTDIKLSYISIPVSADYNVTERLTLMAGPQCSFLIYDNENLLRDNNAAFKKVEVSANASAQFNIANVGLYLRYNKGVSNINNIDNRYAWRSQHIQTGVAIKIK